ncbi:MAG: hypothetical protein OK474_03375 [Thaumarchaeota archaeon]|nr:hypothetical protein [Nitrososphaerota archaeon]
MTIVHQSNPGVLVVEGLVERMTGGGKFVVAPVREYADVDVGNRVMIIVLDKMQPEVVLETLKERVTWPFASNWAILVRGNRYIDRCSVTYGDRKLSALDMFGVARTELSIPRDGVLIFRVPETISIENEDYVEVRDGFRSIGKMRFGSIEPTVLKELNPTVDVSGTIAPMQKVGAYPTNINFTSVTTGQNFWAVVSNNRYSVQLPNRDSYTTNVTWTIAPGNEGGMAEAGTLNLNLSEQAYSFDITW